MLELPALPPHVARTIQAGRVHREGCRLCAGIYTVGLSHLESHPELLVRSLDATLYQRVADTLIAHIMAGVRYHPGGFEVLGLSARIVALTPKEIALHMPVFNAAACYPPAALQIVLAEDGVFPWDRGGGAESLLAFPAWRIRGDA